MELINNTAFAADRYVLHDVHGRDELVVVVKASFIVDRSGKFEIAGSQREVKANDEYFGAPGESSIRYECDYIPPKSTTDVVLVGQAYAPNSRARECNVSIAVGATRKTCRVFGERRWEKRLGMWHISAPEDFEVMPLIYENAFGGRDESAESNAYHEVEWRNPVGCGFKALKSKLEDLKLPNIENAAALIKRIQDRPNPAGFGFIGRNWSPRRQYAGTYDEAWERTRAPLLPEDFNPRYYNGAHPDLVTSDHLIGGELVEVINATRDGVWRFALPRVSLDIAAVKYNDDPIRLKSECDTVIVEPDESRITMIFRARLRVYKELTKYGLVRIKLNGLG